MTIQCELDRPLDFERAKLLAQLDPTTARPLDLFVKRGDTGVQGGDIDERTFGQGRRGRRRRGRFVVVIVPPAAAIRVIHPAAGRPCSDNLWRDCTLFARKASISPARPGVRP